MTATAIDYAPKTKIRLGGFLGKKYGKHHHFLLERGDAREATKALDANYPGFARDLADSETKGLRFAIFKNGKNISEGELNLGGARELWLVPVVHGSKRGGLLQTVLGVALIVAASFASGGLAAGLMGAGIANVAGGVLQLLSPQASGLSHSGSPRTWQATPLAVPRTPQPAVYRYRSASVNAAGAGQSSLHRSRRKTRLDVSLSHL